MLNTYIYSFFDFVGFGFKSKPLTMPTKIKNRTKCKCAFALASITPSLNEVFKKTCTNADPKQAVTIGYAIPFLMGSSPLFNGKKAPPQPAIVPHMIGPKRGNENTDGAMAALAANVNVRTTFALTHS